MSVEAFSSNGVIFFSIFDWWYHSHGHSDFQLALAMAESRNVLFVNSIGMRAPLPGKASKPLRRICRKLKSMTRLVRRPLPGRPNLWVFTPVFLPVYGSRRVMNLNAVIIRWQLRLIGGVIGLRNPLRIFTPPTALPVLKKMSGGALIYNRSDRHSAFSGAGALLASLESDALASAKLVLYSSASLMKAEAESLGGRGLFLGHGIAPDAFNPRVSPDPEVTNLPGIKVGFCGDLREHAIDFSLIEAAAKNLPRVSFVLIGDQTSPMTRLRELPNVHILASRPYDRMPGCWNALDVAMMPYRITPWTLAIQPIKLREILAIGLPIVGTEIPALVALGERARVVGNEGDFIEAIREMTNSRPQRWETGKWLHPTWSELAGRIMDAAKRV